jgi:hypothetical protein
MRWSGWVVGCVAAACAPAPAEVVVAPPQRVVESVDLALIAPPPSAAEQAALEAYLRCVEACEQEEQAGAPRPDRCAPRCAEATRPPPRAAQAEGPGENDPVETPTPTGL